LLAVGKGQTTLNGRRRGSRNGCNQATAE
jgi:hypothetical protein